MIDTNVDWFMWVEEAVPDRGARFVLQGSCFHDGIQEMHHLLEERWFVVNREGSVPLEGERQLVHRTRGGWRIEFFGAPDQFPGLITTNSKLRWAFRESVGVESAVDPTDDVNWVFEFPVALVGRNWLGIASLEAGTFTLDAFTCGQTELGSRLRAFSPDLAEDIDDDQGVFVVTRG